MRFLFLFLLPLFLNAIQIKIASYNVENLFDMVNNGAEYTAYKPKKHNWTRTTLNKKLLNISETICDINADIIGLQEIENENILKLLQKSLRSTGCYYKYLAITHKKKSAIQVAVLSKIPITNAKEIVVNKKLKYRNILEVKFMIEERPFFVYVNHWTSKNSAESKRILSAQVLKKRLDKLPKDMDYILLGDFNSDYNEYKHMEVQHNDTHGKTGINHILKTIINHRLVNKNNIYKDNGLHYNLWLELPNFQRWSHNFYGKKQGLDAIIIPHSMFDGKGIDYNNNSFKVIKSPYLFHKKGYIYRWQYKKERHIGKGYSDHLPIVATFSTKAYKPDINSLIIKDGEIKELYKKGVKSSLLLKNVKVIFKSSYHAIIKQSKDGRAIFVYGADGLEQGKTYDIVVNKSKEYNGLHEIINFSIIYDYGDTNIDNLYYKGKLDFSNRKLENEVLKNIDGIYRNNRFYVDKKAYKIFFKNKRLRPKNGTKLKLHRVQIGYYDEMQLVVWDAEDFTIVE
jgi:endonuclease/exonuclease/phosphatase family metal-dependent hydrolase